MGCIDAESPRPPMDILDWQAYRNLSLQPHGFGEERVRIWPRLVNVDDTTFTSDHKHEPTEFSVWSDASFELDTPQRDELDGDPHADERQIELDTDRSFVLYPVAPEGVTTREKLQTALNRLIVSVFRRRPRLHYFQGYHDIVSVVFLTLPKELHLPVTEKLSLHRVRDSMGTNLDPVVGLLRVLKSLLQLVDPQFAESVERAAPLPYYALSNLLTLFSHDVPTLPLIQHIFDYLLCRPPIVIVYLAAALILTRRQEVQALEAEGEEGMMHSLLTVLPDLYEEGDDCPEPTKVEKPFTPRDESTDAEPKTEEVEHVEPGDTCAPSTDFPSPEVSHPDQIDHKGSADASSPESSAITFMRELSADAFTDTGSDTLVDADEPAPTLYDLITPSVLSSPEPRVKVDPSDPPLPSTEDLNGTLPLSPPGNEVEKPPLPSSEDKQPPPARTPSPELLAREPRPRRPRISLSALLMHADDLMRQYPPMHPKVALSTIMGPQSVVHTWSERAEDLPDDEDAERMVARPELVVLPPPSEPEEEEEEPWERKRREKEERRRRKLRKPRRFADVIVQRKAMVAGAVIVLGVAVAVYGFNGGLPGMGGGHGHGHGHGGQRGATWRKVGKMLGGLAVGVGERVFDGIRHVV